MRGRNSKGRDGDIILVGPSCVTFLGCDMITLITAGATPII